ncbi:hypothetical protein HRbin01_01766 [archaeon HR01]|nr:hypothetical protein HRbin01_01766 [archaeon HR01]
MSIKKRLNFAFRYLTGGLRALPDFIIIGEARCGTSSLYKYITSHPQVIPAFRIEVHFFDVGYSLGLNWYRAHFPVRFWMKVLEMLRGSKVITGEKSPYYMFHPHAPRRIAKLIPHVKLIALLRNPVDRAYSLYQLRRRRGLELLTFEEAIEREKRLIPSETEKMLHDENYNSIEHRRYSYISRGIYIKSLSRWFQFFPREQFLILKSENLFENPNNLMQRVFDFLNIRRFEEIEYVKYHEGKYPEMNPRTRRELVEFYRPYNEELQKLLGQNFNWYE